MSSSEASGKEKQAAGVASNLQGSCACGAVCFELLRPPDVQGYCHCNDCLRVSGCPIRESIAWADTADFMAEGVHMISGQADEPVLHVTKGKNNVTKYNHTPGTDRYFCKTCGNPLFAYMAAARITTLPPINVDGFVFRPTMHVRCTHAPRGSMAAWINDGLPKYKDAPAEFGGTGTLLG